LVGARRRGAEARALIKDPKAQTAMLEIAANYETLAKMARAATGAPDLTDVHGTYCAPDHTRILWGSLLVPESSAIQRVTAESISSHTRASQVALSYAAPPLMAGPLHCCVQALQFAAPSSP
jgi:hypothetical protein